MKEGNRKVDEQAREVIANIMLFDVSDPRLELVTITGCSVSYDRAYCDVYYSVEPVRGCFQLIEGSYPFFDGEKTRLEAGA